MSVADRIRRWLPGARRTGDAAPPGMVPADKLAAQARREAATAEPAGAGYDRELLAQRDRLAERFTMMQADLGGVFYEMVIRDHVRMDVLTRKAAELQRIDADLAQVERTLRGDLFPPTPAVGACAACGTPHAVGARFCASCGAALAVAPTPPHVNGNGNGARP